MGFTKENLMMTGLSDGICISGRDVALEHRRDVGCSGFPSSLAPSVPSESLLGVAGCGDEPLL